MDLHRLHDLLERIAGVLAPTIAVMDESIGLGAANFNRVFESAGDQRGR